MISPVPTRVSARGSKNTPSYSSLSTNKFNTHSQIVAPIDTCINFTSILSCPSPSTVKCPSTNCDDCKLRLSVDSLKDRTVLIALAVLVFLCAMVLLLLIVVSVQCCKLRRKSKQPKASKRFSSHLDPSTIDHSSFEPQRTNPANNAPSLNTSAPLSGVRSHSAPPEENIIYSNLVPSSQGPSDTLSTSEYYNNQASTRM